MGAGNERDMQTLGYPQDEFALTECMKRMLLGSPEEDALVRKSFVDIDTSYGSVFEIARSKGMNLAEWVKSDPEAAVRHAEYALAEWQSLVTLAAIKGVISYKDSEGYDLEYELTKPQVQLIESRVKQAEKELDAVNEIALTCAKSG